MELWEMGAVALGELIAAGTTSSRDVVQAHLDRIEAVNPQVNAIVEVLAERALATADTADRQIHDGARRSPLHGVPFTVKVNIDLEGSATTHGVLALRHAVAPVDSPTVARLRAAGAIPIGRTNMPDFGLRWHTDNTLYGPAGNPWDATRTPGGSGGGDAAAVATGCSPLTLGGDYGGSLRLPAQACGVSSLRPTPGRLPSASATAPVEPTMTYQLFASHGPMARHAADLDTVFGLVAGHHDRDPWTVPAPLAGPEVPRRVAVTVDPSGAGVDPQVAEGIRRAADALADAGYEVAEVEPPHVEEGARMWAALVVTEISLSLPMWRDNMSDQQRLFTDLFLETVPGFDLAGYAAAIANRLRIARAWTVFQTHHPIVLGPVSTHPPFTVGSDLAGTEAVSSLLDAFRLLVLVNLVGLPVATSPVGVAGGLPQAVQLIGPRYREDLCLEAARVLEDRFGVLTPITPAPGTHPGTRNDDQAQT
jgi:amidase